ncbi:DNase I-like protein [Hesseltinella vesiculosa]|uniref:DNase I-like protein n=1 Tax=Hesseltinella vesiculosa TaxID=101127 RepID=A0A1X2GK40_9FUNG|nr:DNase I-like protein [Hesseltinella vesiculosa]
MESSTEAYVYYDPTKQNAWVDAILNGLGPNKQRYYKVASLQLVTLLVIVIAKTEYFSAISEVETTSCAVGLMNMIGNKGGCAVRLRLYDSYLCFVVSHLAAFTNNCERRNQDFREIAKRVLFKHQSDPSLAYLSHAWNGGGDEGVAYLAHHGTVLDSSKQASVFHADHLIWLGDLNYRINLSEAEVKQRLAVNNYEELLDYDQLMIERRAGRTFPMFEEGPVEFAPTYKFDAGTDRYDTSAKRRAPSWTDRILWKKPILGREGLTQLNYNNCMAMMLSDHKPVQSVFRAQIRELNRQKQSATRRALQQQLTETPEEMAKGTISSSFIEFDDVQFLEYKEKTLVLENTGQVVAPFYFLAKLDEAQAIPPWLQVSPQQGLLGPGEKILLQFEIMIDASVSAPFNQGQELSHILILRLENAKDFFISIRGNYQRTCFGVPLHLLSPMTIPSVNAEASLTSPPERRKHLLQSAKTTLANPSDPPGSVSPSSSSSSLSTSQQANLPKELWRLLTFLWNKNMLTLPNLFLEHGDRMICDYIRKCLDAGDTFDPSILLGEEEDQTQEAVGANSVIDVLVAFLECLPEPVIPTQFYAEALAASDAPDRIKLLKDKLPPLYRNVLLYITSFLADAIQYAPAAVKQDRRSCIVSLFTVLLRPDLAYKETNPALAQLKKEKLISHLLSIA